MNNQCDFCSTRLLTEHVSSFVYFQSIMEFCFRCQCFTENLNQEFRLTKNGREWECSLCALCNCEKSRFVGKKRKRKNTSSMTVSRPPQTAYMVDNHNVGSSAFNEYIITRSTSNDTMEEKKHGRYVCLMPSNINGTSITSLVII